MTFNDSFLSMMNSTIHVSSLSGLSTDGYGTATFTTGVPYRARIVGHNQLVRSFAGLEEVSRTQAWVASTSTFDESAQFTLPDGSVPVVLGVESYPDSEGQHHQKVMFS